MPERTREPGYETQLGEDPPVVLFAERLRDGRVARGTRTRQRDGSWAPGELHLLEPPAALDLAGWLAPTVEQAWGETIRERQAEPLRTAAELFGGEPGAVERMAGEILREISPGLLARALILLAHSIGPDARARLIARLNGTTDASEEAALRRQMADEGESFAYVIAAAALFDALDRGITADDRAGDEEG